MNRVIITGRTVRDFELRQLKSGTNMAKTSVAVDSGFGDNKRTDFIPISVFGKKAEYCDSYVKKGRLVEVEGSVKIGSYEKKDGTKIQTFEVYVDELKTLESDKNKPVARPVADEHSDFPNFQAVTEQIPF